MNLFFWRTPPTSTPTGYAQGEQIDAKRTSKLGYFFLILMVIFGVWQGNNFLGALQDTIPTPPPNTACHAYLNRYVDNSSQDSYYYSTYNTDTTFCNYTNREIELSIDAIYQGIATQRAAASRLTEDIYKIESALQEAEYSREQTVSDYQLSLLEEMAATNNRAFTIDSLYATVVTKDQYLATLRSELANKQQTVATYEQQITTYVSQYAPQITQAADRYEYELTVNELLRFVLSLFFIVPVFAFTWRRYHAAKNALSPYTIIWGGALAMTSLLLTQILLVFIYQILPDGIIQAVFLFLAAFKFLWVLLYWLSFILVPLFFGFLIYLIQKKYYNPQAVMMRALKSSHCPNCALKIHPGMNACPVCGYRIKHACTTCGAMTLSGGNYCESCGVPNPHGAKNNDSGVAH